MSRSHSLHRLVVLVLVIAACCLAAEPAAARERTDVVTLPNGDRVTGEIQSLDRGILQLSTDNMGTISIEWVAVLAVESRQLFEVTERGGERFVGTISRGDLEHEFEIVGVDGEFVLAHDDIVGISQLEGRWWDRWSGFVDLGAMLASANAQTDLTVDSGATYRSDNFRLENRASFSVSDREVSDGDQVTETSTSRMTVTSNFQRFMRRNRFWYSQLQFARNEELDLKLRSSIGAGVGRHVLQTPRSQLSAYTGISALREDYYGQDAGEWSAELMLGGSYQLYIFVGQDTTLDVDLSLLPSLTVSNRYRVEFSSSFRRKLVRDFTVSFSLDESYDSAPPEGSESSDLVFRTTLGWSF